MKVMNASATVKAFRRRFASSGHTQDTKPVEPPAAASGGEQKQNSINGLFITQLTRIFALKYALGMAVSSRLLDSSPTPPEEVRKELHQMLDDLKRTQKWTETTIRQTEKAIQESLQASPLRSKSSQAENKLSRLKQIFLSIKTWFQRVSTN